MAELFKTHILLKIFLTVLDRRLPKLCRHLRRRIVYELPILPEEVPRGPRAWLLLLLLRVLLLLLRVRITVAGLLGLIRNWRRRRPELGDGRDVLRNGVVEGGRVAVAGGVHRRLGRPRAEVRGNARSMNR